MQIHQYAFGNAANDARCAKGPAILKATLEKQPFARHFTWHPSLQVDTNAHKKSALPDILTLSSKLAQATQRSVQNKQFFVTLGGDHTAAIGSWNGAAHALTGDLGLIWFDAHMDSHTFNTTQSQNIHGMPLAILLGHGDHALTHLNTQTPILKPENVVLIGVRSFEPGEAALLKKLNVKIFYMTDIEKLGIQTVLQQAVSIVTKNTAGFGISIDLDGFDPLDAPGVGMPEKNGVSAHDFLKYFSIVTKNPKLIGADIVEFNPEKDKENKTVKLILDLFKALSAATIDTPT